MAYYIVYFDGFNKVMDVVKYSENDYEQYMKDVAKAIEDCKIVQYGYF